MHLFPSLPIATNRINPNENFSKRLRLWRAHQNLTQAEAADQLGIDRSYLSLMERGRRPGKALRERFLILEKASKVFVDGCGLRNLPLLSWMQAQAAREVGGATGEWDEVIPSDTPDEAAFAVRLRGDSMEPKFSEGDIAFLLPSSPASHGDAVIANLRDDGLVCKIMQTHFDRNRVMLSSYNPAYPPMERHRDQFHWIFPIATILRQLRR